MAEGPSPSPSPESAALGAGSVIGRYTIVSRLGVGGMGVVYLAYDPELDRRVALKLLHPGNGRSKPRARARLLREAQSLAKLSHPNVVSVFDAGEHQGAHGKEVWLAMERVDGRTLTEWCAATLPRWSELLRVLVDAARGVAAAHAAGLVHRDLKPSNVMVGDDGRVRVMDFGLARRRNDDSSSGSASGFDLSSSSSSSERPSSPQVQSLTQTHDVLGTPAYMAPEQWDGQAIDARADQFSWCVMAWEAFYGQRPYGDEPAATLLCDKIIAPSKRTPAGRVPKWIRRLLERGLRREPQERWRDMAALLDVVERRLSRRRQQRVTLVLSGIFLIGLVGNGIRKIGQKHREEQCRIASVEVESLWPGRKAELTQMLASSDAAYVRHLESSLVPRLDTWVEDWKAVRRDVCEAATVDKSIDASHRAQVEVCLHGQRIAISMLLDLIVRGDPMALRRAPFMTSTFPEVGQCRDQGVLDALPIPKIGELGTVRQGPRRWLQALTLQDAGRYDEALVEAEAVLEIATDRGWDPLKVQAMLLVATLKVQLGQYRQGAEGLRQLYFEAGGLGMEAVAVSAAARLVEVEGVMLARPEQGLQWVEHARMMARRLDTEESAHELLLLENEAKVARIEGDYDRAEQLLERAVEQRRQVQGADHPEVALVLRDLARTHAGRGDHPTSIALYRQVERMLVASLGHDHPEVAKTLLEQAQLQSEQESDEGRSLVERSLAVMAAAVGPRHPELAGPLHELAELDLRRGDVEQARQRHEEALALREEALPAEHPEIARSLGRLAKFHRMRGDYTRANELYVRALDLVERTLGLEHPQRARLLSSLAVTQTALGAWEESEASFEKAIALQSGMLGGDRVQFALTLNHFATLMRMRGQLARAGGLSERARILIRRQLGPTHSVLGYPTCSLAETAIARGDADEAMRLGEESLELLAPRKDFRRMADCRFVVAKARWQQEEGSPEALSLAEQVAQTYREFEETKKLQAVTAWLAARTELREDPPPESP